MRRYGIRWIAAVVGLALVLGGCDEGSGTVGQVPTEVDGPTNGVAPAPAADQPAPRPAR